MLYQRRLSIVTVNQDGQGSRITDQFPTSLSISHDLRLFATLRDMHKAVEQKTVGFGNPPEHCFSPNIVFIMGLIIYFIRSLTI